MNLNKIILALVSLLLYSCTPAPQEVVQVESISSTGAIVTTSTGIVENIEKIEELPEYLNHTLNWSGLTFVKVLENNSVYTRYQISYLSDGLRISGIMNIPKWENKYPLVILNHGHIDTNIYTLGRGLKREQDYLARNGFAVLHTDYRNHAFSDKDQELIGERTLSRTVKYGSDSMNAIIAVRSAIEEWMTEVSNVDAEKVGMLGHSMGGWVTMYSLVAHPDLIDAAVLYAPVHSNEYYNFHRWMKNRLSQIEYTTLETKTGPLGNTGTFLPFSPEGYPDRIETPIQMYWGTSDASCPIEWGRYMDERFRSEWIALDYIEYANEWHEFSREWTNFMEGVVLFYKEKLGS